ncbi:NADH dehydrogenase [Mucilaginibacter sp. PPCGB 2223]|uniref:NADH-quinone oxidoreductase subunit L n=1 Tax=Mucilaginibacter sp. PPCGB 2223 TaxID=1886027 RepID=UPI00082571C3|nr:NADH-quinone oxidoreductase subunit L [Mucilaginibacter sp. PPCGB 2223]OCX54125.1 NADH dehydrogenase [Mucilaginibacter sp. PPCGB 2223]
METVLTHSDISVIQLAVTAVVLPFVAFLLNLFIVPRQSKLSGVLSGLAIGASLALSVFVFFEVWNQPALHVQQIWFTVGSTQIRLGIWLNNLSVLMLLLVSAIALPVHVYSIAYMKGDNHYTRYFAYLSLFCFAMLALVVVDNLLLLYAFWEMVGFASYLLIGFWFTREKAIQANKKAFLMNRIGDVALLTGIMLVYTHYDTFDIVTLFGDHSLATAAATATATKSVTIAGLCFLAGAVAKSAQFPLHTWLPDAMEGPTSVSALIHAATMVAAGIFLLGRVYPLFNTEVLTVIAIVGCFTAFMAATIALTQTDLKRILAYSTISQLGYMMMAMGIGAYSSALFHLATHAFFKCLLFLAAGVIIHEMQHLKRKHRLHIDAQNINNMGGLRKIMPVTFITCCVAALALIGFPLTAGCLSKDGILIQGFAWAEGKGWAYSIIPIGAVLTSLLTAFYIGRLMFKVFFGESGLEGISADSEPEAHEENPLLYLPMILLALGSLFPLFSLNPLKFESAWIVKGFADMVNKTESSGELVPFLISALSVCVVLIAYGVYVRQKLQWLKFKGVLFNMSYNQWYIDTFYNGIIVRAVVGLSRAASWFDTYVIDGIVKLIAGTGLVLSRISAWIDRYIIDGIIHSITYFVKQAGNFIRGFQTGRVQGYLFTMLIIVLALYILKTFI